MSNKSRLKVAKCVLTFCVGFMVLTSSALAASHGISGCMFIFDIREGTSTEGSYAGIPDLTVAILYEVLGVMVPAIGTLTTNSSGCYSGTLSGFTVPKNTKIKLQVNMESSRFSSIDETNAIYAWDLGEISVSSGGAANFGDVFIDDDEGDHYGAQMNFLNAHDAIQLYQSRVQAFPSTYPKLKVVFPASDGTFMLTGGTEMHIASNDFDNFQDTFLHEWTHYLQVNDASSTFTANYCSNYSPATYPERLDPYRYLDPDFATGSCGHSPNSYEDNEEAAVEGHADGVADFLFDGVCKNFPPFYDPSFDVNYFEFNFDGSNREANVAGAVCDLMDSDRDSKTWAHSYGSPGHVTTATSPGFMTPFAFDSTDAYGGYLSEIRKFDFATLTTTTAFDLSAAVGAVQIFKVALSGNNLCASYSSSGMKIGCVDLSVGTFTDLTAQPTHDSTDIRISGRYLYSIGSDGISNSIQRTLISSPGWSTVYSEAVGVEWRSIAISSTGRSIYIGRANDIVSCALPFCATLSAYAGNAGTQGYKRGDKGSSYFYNIDHIVADASYVWVSDQYGVSRISLSTGIVEQYLGIGRQNYFLNNLSRRSMNRDEMPNSGFAIGTNVAVTDAYFQLFSDTRSDSGSFNGLTKFDDSITKTETVYCGTDTASVSPKYAVHLFDGIPHESPWSTLISNINAAAGLTLTQKSDVEKTNWIVPYTSQECELASGEEIIPQEATASLKNPKGQKPNYAVARIAKIKEVLAKKSARSIASTDQDTKEKHTLNCLGVLPESNKVSGDYKTGTARSFKSTKAMYPDAKVPERIYPGNVVLEQPQK